MHHLTKVVPVQGGHSRPPPLTSPLIAYEQPPARERFRIRARLHSCHPDRTRIYGMAESHPPTLIKTPSSRAKSRDLVSLEFSGQRTPPPPQSHPNKPRHSQSASAVRNLLFATKNAHLSFFRRGRHDLRPTVGAPTGVCYGSTGGGNENVSAFTSVKRVLW